MSCCEFQVQPPYLDTFLAKHKHLNRCINVHHSLKNSMRDQAFNGVESTTLHHTFPLNILKDIELSLSDNLSLNTFENTNLSEFVDNNVPVDATSLNKLNTSNPSTFLNRNNSVTATESILWSTESLNPFDTRNKFYLNALSTVSDRSNNELANHCHSVSELNMPVIEQDSTTCPTDKSLTELNEKTSLPHWTTIMNSKKREIAYRKELTELELSLEELRFNIANNLTTADILQCNPFSPKDVPQEMIPSSSISYPNEFSGLLDDTDQTLKTSQPIFERFFFPLKEYNHIKSNLEHNKREQLSAIYERLNLDNSKVDGLETFLGHLSRIEGMNSICYPSNAASANEFTRLLLELPVLSFYHLFTLFDTDAIPHLKQDSKDLTRDIIRINGQSISGTLGYQYLYQTLASHIVPSSYRNQYVEEISTNSKTNESEINTTNLYQSFPDEADDAVKEINSKRNYSASNDKNTTDVYNIFSTSEMQAIFLLHLVNRTLAGGHCFEKVLSVFSNDTISLVAPNSTEAQPLDIIVYNPETNDENEHINQIALLRSHTSFRIFPAGIVRSNSDQPADCYAELDAYFISEINLSNLDQKVLQHFCSQIQTELQRPTSTIAQERNYLSSRLDNWIRCTAEKDNPQAPGEVESADHQIPYRIYIRCKPCI